MKSWGLSVNSKGADRAFIREQKQKAKEMERQLKAEQKSDAYWREAERKLKLKDWKIKAEDKYKSLSEQKRYEEKLKAKYGLTKQKFSKANQVKLFMKYNKGISNSKIISRNAPNQFNARSQTPLPPERTNPNWNPFAHKSEMEVYGDEGLTLFDGDKRADDDTGSLFGISRRRSR